MKFFIKNGILFADTWRIVLCQVCAYEVTGQNVIVHLTGGRSATIPSRMETEKLAMALDDWFSPLSPPPKGHPLATMMTNATPETPCPTTPQQ